MKVKEAGHRYLLSRLDGEGYEPLNFVMRIGEKYPGNKKAHTGTTCQEVLRALIDRVKYVQLQRQWVHNVLIIQSLRLALWLLESRAHEDRHEFFKRSAIEIEILSTCPQCLHIDCTKHGGCKHES